ncbi:MAG: ATP-dependent 6-phosphofructokinase [Desulfovibrio sp.]|uniref:ATP-dependent 6-phosphofructokinase n=1 Tax=Desulfovibrio sp. 7SRBS1 TaxID=3378064 RepID=UPI003B3CCF96
MSQEMTCIEPADPPKDTTIPTLGPAKVESFLKAGNYADDDNKILIYVRQKDMQSKQHRDAYLEPAGPRKNIYFDPSKTKCAIVTCGGLCPGINDVIRSIVLEAHYNYDVAETLGIRYGLEGFIESYGHDPMVLTPEVVTNIHEFGGTILGTSRGPQSLEAIVDFLERRSISILFVIGGDGTMKAAKAIMDEVTKRGVKISIIGIPKTIDNDIHFVSQTFGFDTAVEKVTEAIRCAHTEALGVPNGIGLVKVMGRESGFIAAQASLALRDVDFVLVPEQPFALEGENGLLQAMHKRLKMRQHAVMVVAEGAGQDLLRKESATDASGNVRLGDICGLLRKELDSYLTEQGMDYTLKFIDPSYIIRSIPANSNDRIYCGFLGQNAVHAGMAGKTGMIVSKWNGQYVHMPLSLVITQRKRIDICSNYWRSVLESTGQLVYFGTK